MTTYTDGGTSLDFGGAKGGVNGGGGKGLWTFGKGFKIGLSTFCNGAALSFSFGDSSRNVGLFWPSHSSGEGVSRSASRSWFSNFSLFSWSSMLVSEISGDKRS